MSLASGVSDLATRIATECKSIRSLLALKVDQSTIGIWIGTQQYATLQDAIDAATAAGGGRITFYGDYTPTTLPIINANNIQVVGEGTKSILRPAAGQTEVLRVGDKTSGAALSGIELADFRIAANASVTKALNIIAMQFSLISNLRIDGASAVGAIGMVFDTQSTGAFIGAINNTVVGCYVNTCYHGVKLTRDPAKDAAVTGGTSSDDGCNHNTFVGTRVASFTGIGFDVDHGENVKLFGIDSSTGNDGATGLRINDDVCSVYSVRTDNSFGAGNTAIGIRLTANARDHDIRNPTGNGPTTRILWDDPTIYGMVTRQAFTTLVGNERRTQAATGSDYWKARAWTNISTSTIANNEVGYFDSTCGEGQVKRVSSTLTCTNPMVAIEAVPGSGGVGGFAEAGSVVSVKCDTAAVAVGDLLVPSTASNGSAMTNNANTNPRLCIGRARTAKAAGAAGPVKVLIV